MKLAEAYSRLQFVPPLEHERRVAAVGERRDPFRRFGTSARMLMELYLDLEVATRRTGSQHLPKIKFLCVCLSPHQADYLRNELTSIHKTLNLDVDVARVRFFVHNGNVLRLVEHRYRTWGVFCDHAVKELAGTERPYGPYALVRTIRREGDTYAALDRDGRHVCRLTCSGKNDLVSASSSPIHYYESPRVSGTTFPAWTHRDARDAFRVKKAFEL